MEVSISINININIEIPDEIVEGIAMFGAYLFVKAVTKAFGGDRDDQEFHDWRRGSLHVRLECLTNERFLEVFEDYKSGRMKNRLNKELSSIGIKTEGMVVEIENIEEVEEKAAAINPMRRPQIIVKGGAHSQRIWHDIKDEMYMNVVKESAKKGYDILENGGTAVDAVEAAVRVLEDSEYFNAGYGSALNDAGEVECDAMIMDGNTLNCGSVISGRHFRNPVSLAKLIMKDSGHCALSGEGALEFARKKGFPVIYDMEELITQRARDEHRLTFNENVAYRVQGSLVSDEGSDIGDTTIAVEMDDNGDTVSAVAGESSGDTTSAVAGEDTGDTVSAVARDIYGHFACAVSTGGIGRKRKGRVSDASMVGCGGYANKYGAATTSGPGESLIKMTLARDVVYMMESGRNAQDSANKVLKKMKKQLKDKGGVIAIDQQGNFGSVCTTKIMGWVSIKDRTLRYGFKANEIKQQQLP